MGRFGVKPTRRVLYVYFMWTAGSRSWRLVLPALISPIGGYDLHV